MDGRFTVRCAVKDDYTPPYLPTSLCWCGTGYFMLLVYPVGIPCLYFVLTWRCRHKLDPDALFVASDVACGGRLTDDSVPVTEEIHQLAQSVVLIHGAAADVEQKAIERHTEALDKQNTARARLASEDSQRAVERRGGREAHRSSLFRATVVDRATKMRDQRFVPDKWEDYLQEEAAVVIHLKASAAVVEAELVHQYRGANPSVQVLSFLVGAYEVRVAVGVKLIALI